MPAALHIDLDRAWNRDEVPFQSLDATEWGPRLRFSTPPRSIENFYREHAMRLTPFLLYGSGDFHHLSALWLRRLTKPAVVISFDNHPDWDIRPPKWCCGGWVNRALELSNVECVSVWGCGNFECWWPRQIFGNRRAERTGRLEVHPWADERPVKDRQRRGAILRENWREHLELLVDNLRGAEVYVTIDLDCLGAQEAVTNWESGRFTAADLEWALGKLRESCRIVAGDICGAFSEPAYARWKQRLASEMDHPKVSRPDAEHTREVNYSAFKKLWPLLAE